MPRRPRRGLGGYTLHVINRGARRGALFTSPQDYVAFETVLREALDRYVIDLYEYCAMPNHFHFVLRPPVEEDLRGFMHWLTTTHAVRWRLAHDTVGEGAVYQGRYKAIPVETATYFITLCRYVARNPVRARLAERAEDWRWSVSWRRGVGPLDLPLAPWPIPRPINWLELVNTPLDPDDEQKIRTSVNRGCPLGNASWQEATAKLLGIQHTLRPRGRPPTTVVAGRKN